MSRHIMEKQEAINLTSNFEKYLKERDGIELNPREQACLKRFIYWLYDYKEQTISWI